MSNYWTYENCAKSPTGAAAEIRELLKQIKNLRELHQAACDLAECHMEEKHALQKKYEDPSSD